jgi:hypothetical protein
MPLDYIKSGISPLNPRDIKGQLRFLRPLKGR